MPHNIQAIDQETTIYATIGSAVSYVATAILIEPFEWELSMKEDVG